MSRKRRNFYANIKAFLKNVKPFVNTSFAKFVVLTLTKTEIEVDGKCLLKNVCVYYLTISA